MAVDSRLSQSLQQDIITLLCHSDEHGKIIAKTIDARYFEGDLRNIAERSADYWKQYQTAPKQHTSNLFADILENKGDRRAQTYQRILVNMYEMRESINPDYVLQSLTTFIRTQRAKEVILQSAEQLDARGVSGLEDVELGLQQFLRERVITYDKGLRLDDVDRVLAYLENTYAEFLTGVKELDSRHIVPMRGKIFIMLAPTGLGKTWWLVNIGKMAFMLRKKVCHITLEIEAEEVAQRYYQAMFAASKRDDTSEVTTLSLDRSGNISDFKSETLTAPFTFNSDAIREELRTRVNHFGTRVGNILIKRFPMRGLSVEGLEAYLENLEAVDHFTPDLVIVDYPGIMKTDAKNHRISLGRLVEELRGLAQRRNFALAAAHQVSKGAVDADMVRATHVSEDWSIIGTADIIVTYSQTAAEARFGLARLYVAKARSEEDKFGVLITQSYRTGQFVLDSVRLSDQYTNLMERIKANSRDKEDEDSENDD